MSDSPMIASMEAEVSVLGAAMLSVAAAEQAAAVVTADDFARTAHRIVWQAIVDLLERDERPDALTVLDRVQAAGRLDEIGGGVGIHELVQAAPTAANAAHYARIVADRARRRRFAEAAARAYRDAADLTVPLDDSVVRLDDAARDAAAPDEDRLRVYADEDLDTLPEPEWLVHKAVEMGLCWLFGQSGHFKSFVALDWAFHIVSGKPWHGRPVRQGPVLYVAAEGAAGIARRRAGWRGHHQASTRGFHLIGEPVDLLRPDDVALLSRRIGETGAVAVFFDTWARCVSAGDENSNSDMGRAVRALDHLRHRHGCANIVLHHAGHDMDRMRGASSMKGAADTEVYAKAAGKSLTLRCTKQKNADPFGRMDFMLATSGPSLVLAHAPRTFEAESDDDRRERLRTALRNAPRRMIELDQIVDGDHDVVLAVLEEPEFIEVMEGDRRFYRSTIRQAPDQPVTPV